MDRIDSTSATVHPYVRRIVAGQLAARASSASAALAAAVAPVSHTLSALGRPVSKPNPGTSLDAVA
jgi:hypothetical protein